MTTTPHTAELGTAAGITAGYAGLGVPGAPAGYVVEGTDPNVALRFPASVRIYDEMRTTDGKIGSALRALTTPITATRWRIIGDDVPPDVLAHVEQALGLDEGARNARRRHGIDWAEFLRHALLMLPLGFMPFEQVYEVDEQDGRAWVRKLAPRMPSTLTEVRVERDGGLAGITQANHLDLHDWRGTFIPVDRLVVFTLDREGADWTGRSILRTAYKHWTIRDHLLRVSAQAVERNGMGVPVVTYPAEEGNTGRARALDLARAVRAGAEAGAALPEGMTLTLLGVQGSTADALPLIEYHDRAIVGATLTSFLELGHTGGIGQGNVADVFLGVYRTAVESVIANIEATVTRHVIRDLVDLNYGADTPAPMLKADPIDVETAGADVLKTLTDAGLITPDTDLEVELRRRYGLPAKPEGAPAIPTNAAPAAVNTGTATPLTTAASEDTTGDLVTRVEQVTARLAALKARPE